VVPNESVVNSIVKLDVSIVYGVCYCLREFGIENLRMLPIISEDIMHGKINIMDVNDRNL